MTASIVPGRDLVALLDQLGELAHDLAPALTASSVAVERDDVAAQEDVAVEVVLERLQHGVLAARELGGDRVGQLDAGYARALSFSSHERGDALAVGAAVDLRHRQAHHLAHVLRRGGS